MGKITVTLSDEVEEKLRDHVKTRYAGKKGALSIVVEEALRRYLALETSSHSVTS